jgi:hypothetical protein
LTKLQVLAEMLQRDGRFTKFKCELVIEEAYTEANLATVSAATATYHMEGRALKMSLNFPNAGVQPTAAETATLYGDLARTAHLAGFDWVTLLAVDVVYASVAPDGCITPIDLVFLLDSSGSIEDPSIGGVPGQFAEKELEFVKAIVGAFDVGPADNQTRVGVASFSTENEVNFELNQHQSNTDVLDAVDSIDYM